MDRRRRAKGRKRWRRERVIGTDDHESVSSAPMIGTAAGQVSSGEELMYCNMDAAPAQLPGKLDAAATVCPLKPISCVRSRASSGR